MYRAAAALTLFSGQVLAHPGAEGHFHGAGIEHVLLFAVIFALLAFALRKK
jgi:hypothetical protein